MPDDSILLNLATEPGGASVATILDGDGLQHEKVITEFLVAGVPQEVDAANPLPVTDNAAETSLASIDLKINNGTQKTQVVDGSGNVIGATSNALDINIKSGNPTTIAVTQGTATNLKAQAEVYQGGTAVGAAAPLQVTLANTGANTNKILVTPDSVALPANQSVNVNQIAGTAASVNSGNKDNGTLRVVLATDQPNLTTAFNVNETARVASTPTKTASGTLISLQTCASGAVVVGTALDVSTKLGMFIGIHIGRTVTTALTNPAKVRIEATMTTSGTLYWFPIAEFLSSTIASTTTATLTTGTTAPTATLPMTATAGILIGDLVYIQEAGGQTNSEFGRVITVNANTSVVLEEGTTYNHTVTTTKVWSKADYFPCAIDVSRYMRVRAVVDCSYALSGQTIVCECVYSTLDSIV